jgi:hypothetical protein
MSSKKKTTEKKETAPKVEPAKLPGGLSGKTRNRKPYLEGIVANLETAMTSYDKAAKRLARIEDQSETLSGASTMSPIDALGRVRAAIEAGFAPALKAVRVSAWTVGQTVELDADQMDRYARIPGASGPLVIEDVTNGRGGVLTVKTEGGNIFLCAHSHVVKSE